MPEQVLELPTAWGRLAGSLLLPEGAGPWPAVLLIAGSGPTDRDGNTPLLPAPLDNLKRLAQGLAARGIASLRYDKRGVGGSICPGLSEKALRFEHLVDDAGLAARWLAQHERVGRVSLVGHSEGALIAALAAGAADAQAVVSIAGAGCRASTLMRRQIEGNLPPDLAAPAVEALSSLEAGQPVEDVPDALFLLFRPSVQPYLISWFRHDPAEVLSELEVPVLLVHGAADPQVGPEHALALHAARPDARLKIVEGMDHLLSLKGDIPAGTHVVAGEVAAWLQGLDVRLAA
ncbi:alpha/beta fold hydrolase [Ramlibacter sp. USB13]|uniref:Alpha/beta fold hydrolase n=1 Tax=Ramlibacter cellulosilyticus TaxID=2764187 RepID=A0A923MTR4_9BURK|nr:alpha/beta fold hydrolase [Ramlibacter cellulosilyticus]MBC5784831.1 alpha/beta fold hydrolase [Ramlibacter cellulosilyticus]